MVSTQKTRSRKKNAKSSSTTGKLSKAKELAALKSRKDQIQDPSPKSSILKKVPSVIILKNSKYNWKHKLVSSVSQPPVKALKELPDSFGYSVDLHSESQIKSLVEDLNYSLDQAITSIILRINHGRGKCKREHTVRKKLEVPTLVGPMRQICDLLKSRKRLSKDTRHHLLDVLLHHQVCQFLDNNFFTGNILYGAYCPTHSTIKKVLGDIYAEICKKYPWSASEFWRSMTFTGHACEPKCAFDNHDTDAALANDLMHHLKEVISITRSSKGPSIIQSIHDSVDGVQDCLESLVKTSRDISVAIQRDILTPRMKVTTASRATDGLSCVEFNSKYATGITTGNIRPVNGEKIIGTYAFGLKTFSSSQTKLIILPQVATTSIFPSSNR